MGRLFAGILGIGAVVCTWSSCGTKDDPPLCASITGRSDGIQISDCPRGSITTGASTFDASGTKTSYSFVVTCKGQSVHGIWSLAHGIECVEGAYPCEGGICTPVSNADCRVLTNCVELGECGFVDGQCVLTDEGCAQSKIPCALSGACHLVNGRCAATSDTDCKQPFAGCPSCSFKGPCATTGSCSQKDGTCVASDDADCKKSSQCAFAGRCSLEGEACIAATDADCAASEVCRTAGQCAAIAGVCGVH